MSGWWEFGLAWSWASVPGYPSDLTDEQWEVVGLFLQAREKAGRAEDLTAVELDTQSIRAVHHVPAATTFAACSMAITCRDRGAAARLGALAFSVRDPSLFRRRKC
jgi:hypothetical protein